MRRAQPRLRSRRHPVTPAMWAASTLLAVTITTLPAAAQEADDEVPCEVVRSVAHGVVVVGTRNRRVGGPSCELMGEYAAWLRRTDSLLVDARAASSRRFTGREWDFASGAMRIGVPTAFVVVRGDSLSAVDRRGTRRLHLTAAAGDGRAAPEEVGSWYVLIDEDSSSTRLFRSAVTEHGLRVALSGRWGIAWAARGVRLDGERVRAQMAAATRLRHALGFDDPVPPAQFITGSSKDSTLAMLGVAARGRALYAMMVHPPLAVFAPRTADGGVDAHELIHVATLGRRDVVPGTVGEAYAMHAGGSHGRPFSDAFCASKALDTLPPLGETALDSAMSGRWWNDTRADVGGFALGHAIGWFIAERRDSAWIFADGEAARDDDALGYLSRRAGIAREAALAEVTRGFAARRAACPAATRRAAAPAAPRPPSR